MAGDDAGAGRVPAPVRRAGRLATAAVVLVFGALLCGGSPSGLLERGPFTSDFFDEQASALLDGRLSVDPEVVGLEGFVHEGETHLYFGLAPALLRLPVVAVSERFDGRLTQLSLLLALTVACWATTRLAWRARREQRGEAPLGPRDPWIVGGFTLTVGLASPLLFLASRPIVYHEAQIWGVAGALLTAEALLHWWERPGWRRALLVGGSAALALHSRGSLGIGALVAVALVCVAAPLTRRASLRKAAGLAAAATVAVATYAAVNLARFDEPLRVPYDKQVIATYDPTRQAVLEATGGTLFGPEHVPTTLLAYLRPDGLDLQPLFPWITYRDRTTVIGDLRFDTLDGTLSLPVAAPVLLLLGAAAAPWWLRRGVRTPWSAVALGMAAGTAPTLAIAYIAHRYLADFAPLLVVIAAPGAWALAAWAVDRRRALALLAGAVVLAGASTFASVATALQYQRLLFLPETHERTGFVGFQYDVHSRLGGDRPPAVERSELEPSSPARRGEVTVVRGCEALYWSDGTRHWPLEMGGELGVRLPPPDGAGVAATGDGWSLVWVRSGDEVRVDYRGPERRRGSAAELPLDEPIVLWRDLANQQIEVRAGHQVLLRTWLVPIAGTVSGPAGSDLAPDDTPLCDRLVERLDR